MGARSFWLAVLAVSCLVACGVAIPAPGRVEDSGQQQEGRAYLELQAGAVKKFFEKPWHIGAVAGGGAALIILVVTIVVGCYCCYKRQSCCFRHTGYAALERHPLRGGFHSPDAMYMNRNPGQVDVGTRRGHRYERTVGEEFRRQKEEQEQSDRATAKKIVLFHMRNEKKFELVQDLPDMGSRMLKFWFKIRDQEGRERLLTIAPVSQKCPLLLDDKTVRIMNSLLRQLSHPNVHPALNISYEGKDHMVLLTQPFVRGGSLKDAVYRSTPTSEWTMKYSRRSRGLSAAKVALYGKQILEGVLYLYSRRFPHALGHIQTGNIFVDGDTCSIGGYENTLLGYKTRSYKLCKEHLESIDLILFGHVVFEMRCGYELTELVAGEQHYADIKDHSIQEVLEFIFSRNPDESFAHTIEQVYNLDFFQGARPPIPVGGGRTDHTDLSSDAKNLLAKVTKNKPRVQKDKRSRRKSGKSSSALASRTSPSDADSSAPPKAKTNGTPPS